MKILRMKKEGIAHFIAFLDNLRKGIPQEFPQELLIPSSYAEEVGGDVLWLDELDLSDSLKTAKGLVEIIYRLGLKSAERDSGFWTWCSAYLFERLCKKDIKGNFKPGEIPIWVAESNNWQRYYRHYLASIWRVYSAHPDKEDVLVVLLTGPVNTPGELWAQIAATQTLITNKSILDAIYHLFWDKKNMCRKRGAGGESPRRFTRVLKQFALTYDFFAMSGSQIIQMLPTEFDRFKELNVA